MKFFTLEHRKPARQADFVLYSAVVLLMGVVLVLAGPRAQTLPLAALVLAGLRGWTAIEYGLRRFLLHGPQPFRRWHAEHHRRLSAPIGTPPVLGLGLIATLAGLRRCCLAIRGGPMR